ncbi:hypothetical protein QMK19_27970 [Streptomyces sp. H10-C2]|uniref:hypothetical protein n=1 Tax=unclassified Streptomyces TaxID=2593676 RepID=UPI0024BB5224|nr:MULTISPECIES: hypothetical protein [unclassified Streptomyces]MDJ0343947.1 hypothetical protein [Streptomyces sp. PH10-H1]MDJ0373388.1 hypothetical protein [Streptomyces sp. H10-C2]
MDYNITAEEEALVFRLAELLNAGAQPREEEVVDELGSEVSGQLASLSRKGWIDVERVPDSTWRVNDLSPVAWLAIRARRDVGGGGS